MISFPMPDPFYGPLLQAALATEGLETDLVEEDGDLLLPGLPESAESVVEPIVAAHPSAVEAERARLEHDETAEAAIRDQVRAALAANRDFLNDPNLTNADIVAQTKLLTREMTGLIRLIIREFNGDA